MSFWLTSGLLVMAVYVLIHGAGSDPWYWHLVGPALAGLGHEAIAVDLPCDDDSAGWSEYADAVINAAPGLTEEIQADVILVAQSLGGFTAPLVCDRLRARLLILVNAMVPRPGESAGEWWAHTGHVFPDPFEPEKVFAHDLAPPLAAESAHHVRRQSGTVFGEPWPLPAWPDVPTRALLCRDDRFFPAEFQRRVVRDRLGMVPDEMDGGHLPALARPGELVQYLEACRTATVGGWAT